MANEKCYSISSSPEVPGLEIGGSLWLTFDPSGTISGNMWVYTDPGGMIQTDQSTTASVKGSAEKAGMLTYKLQAIGTTSYGGAGGRSEKFQGEVDTSFNSDLTAGTIWVPGLEIYGLLSPTSNVQDLKGRI